MYPQAVDPQRFSKVEMALFCEAAHFLFEQALEGGKGGVALRQIVEARIARIALVAVRAAPPAPRAILFGKQAAALLEIVEQVGRADVGLVNMGGEERATGHDSRQSMPTGSGQGRVLGNTPRLVITDLIRQSLLL